MLLFDRDAYESVAGHHTCYLAMSSLIGLLKSNNVSYGTFDLGQNQRFTLKANLKSKIGFDYGGEYTCMWVTGFHFFYFFTFDVSAIIPVFFFTLDNMAWLAFQKDVILTSPKNRFLESRIPRF